MVLQALSSPFDEASLVQIYVEKLSESAERVTESIIDLLPFGEQLGLLHSKDLRSILEINL